MKKIITLITVLYSFAVYSQNEQIEKIDAIVNAKVAENHPGIMVGIVKDGNIIYERYRGLANLQYEIKVNEKSTCTQVNSLL